MLKLSAKIKKAARKLTHREKEVWDFGVRMEILIVIIAISLFIIITNDGYYYNDFNEILAVFFSVVLILYLLRKNG